MYGGLERHTLEFEGGHNSISNSNPSRMAMLGHHPAGGWCLRVTVTYASYCVVGA